MTRKDKIQLFDDHKVRTVWDDKEEKWYFSIVDVVGILTDSKDPKQYIKKMRSRDPELNANWGTICTLLPLTGIDGKGTFSEHAQIAKSGGNVTKAARNELEGKLGRSVISTSKASDYLKGMDNQNALPENENE